MGRMMDDTLAAKSRPADDGTPAVRPAEMRRRLVAAIADNRLPPGARLPEEKLARVFGTSRAKVRDVLALLARERIVELQPNRGAFVARPTVEEARHICEARMVIERSMARLAAERRSATDLRDLRRVLEEEHRCWDAGDIRSAVRASRNFHLVLASVSGNAVLSDMLENILERSALTQAVYASRGAAGCLCDDHFAILDAVAAQDADRAEQLMVAHIDQMVSRLNLEPDRTEVDIEDALRDSL